MNKVIAENMFAQVDGEVNMHVLFQEIADHSYDSTEVNNSTHSSRRILEQSVAGERQRVLKSSSNGRIGEQYR